MTMIPFLSHDDAGDTQAICDSVAKFASQHLPSVSTFRRSDFSAMAGLGLTGLGIREDCGGTRLDGIATSAILFEISRKNLGPAIYLSVHMMVARLIDAFASNETHKETLKKLADGSALGAFCLTEAQAGSDAAALQTKAILKGERYEISGEKIYISSAPHADVLLVFARTADTGKKGISCFIVDAQADGIEIGPEEAKMGCHASPIASVRFTNCSVPITSRVGDEGEGFAVALSGLSRGRVSIAACACGIAASALEKSQEHLLSRKQFGSALADFQGLQFMFAEMATKLQAAILLTRDASQQIDRGVKDGTAASMAKFFATDAAMSITTDAVQLLGGAGYLSDYGVEQLMRDAKMLQIVEGTNQIQRLIVARNLLHPKI